MLKNSYEVGQNYLWLTFRLCTHDELANSIIFG
jgi:hypothetical protein